MRLFLQPRFPVISVVIRRKKIIHGEWVNDYFVTLRAETDYNRKEIQF